MEIISQKPDFDQNKTLKRFISFSIAIHLALIIFFSLKSALFPDTAREYIPSLRVDLVALPTQKKTEIVEPKKPDAPVPETQTKPKDETKPDIKADQDPGDFAVKKKKKAEHAKKEKEAAKKLKAALDRIKALERVKALTAGEEVKGNKISKGSALTGEAKTSLETTYDDVILERVRSNWELPKWLQEQNLSAQVLLFIDGRGQIRSFKIVKSSGNDQFDSEVKRTLQASAPFPLPPTEIASDLVSNGIKLGFPL